ncbi:hypothetical protein [Acidocella sp.]|uniref:hypothetical protein n=1 Tax=Acidocella sp. TaxID=50710 RepID=UPI003D085FFC
MALMPANRLLTLLDLRRWRLAALFTPLRGPFVFLWLVAFDHAACDSGARRFI